MLYIIATSYQAATDFCRDMHIDPRSRYVRILTRSNQARGIHLQENDGYEYITRPRDRSDNDLWEYWGMILATRRNSR